MKEINHTQRTIPILMYHSISRHAQRAFQPFAVAPETFARHMEYLYEQHFHVLSVSQLTTLLREQRQQLWERTVVLTFDDGFQDFYTDAMPILQRYQFPATLYLPTKYIGGTSTWLWREHETERLTLTWRQIQEIQQSGIECGAHTHSHPQLDLLPITLVKQEIQLSKVLLEDHLGQPLDTFAYPYGYYSASIRQAVIEAGFRSACAVNNEISTVDEDPFTLSRLLVSPSTTQGDLATLLTLPPVQMGAKIRKRTLGAARWLLRRLTWHLSREHSETLKRRIVTSL